MDAKKIKFDDLPNIMLTLVTQVQALHDKVDSLGTAVSNFSPTPSMNVMNGRWYTDVRAWRIEPAVSAQPAAPSQPAAPVQPAAPAPAPGYDYAQSAGSYSAPMDVPMSEDDLPF